MSVIRHGAVVAAAIALGVITARAATPPGRRQEDNLWVTEYGTGGEGEE
jgi:hypothetical protein